MKRFVTVLLLGPVFCVPIACREKQAEKPVSHSDIMGPAVLDKDADALAQTEFTAHLNHPITPGKNLIWCSTMGLAWNELMDLAGGEIHLIEGDPPMVTELDRKTVTRSDLDDSSYVALAGFTPGIFDSITKALKTKFKGQASPELLSQVPKDPGHVVAYSYLFKNLAFEHHFENMRWGVYFSDSKVNGFGFFSHRPDSIAKAADQVRIHDYQSENNFVIEIATKNPNDRLLLAKISPESTLVQTIALVHARANASKGQTPEDQTRLEIPMFNFRMIKDYKELKGKKISSPVRLNGWPIECALQLIRFKFDQEGAKLKSEAAVSADTSGDMVEEEVPQLIFDRPFLILMERKGAANPYFALWVDNPELLVPFVEP